MERPVVVGVRRSDAVLALVLVVAVLNAGCVSDLGLVPSSVPGGAAEATTVPAGAAGTASGGTESGATTPRAASGTSTAPVDGAADNPWAADPVRVAIDDRVGSDHRTEVERALAWWSGNVSVYTRYDFEYVLVDDPNAADVVIRFVDDIGECGSEPDGPVIGCAPFISPGDRVREPTTVRIEAGYDSRTTIDIVRHELGHTLGLSHESPPAFMVAETEVYAPASTNVTDRRNPWNASTLTVHVDVEEAPEARREGYRRVVGDVLDYYETHAGEEAPAGIEFEVVDDPDADVTITFVDRIRTDSGYGIEPRLWYRSVDRDDAYENVVGLDLRIAVSDEGNVETYVGYGVGASFAESKYYEIPERYRIG